MGDENKSYFLNLSFLTKKELSDLQISIDRQLETGESEPFYFSGKLDGGETKLEKLKRILEAELIILNQNGGSLEKIHAYETILNIMEYL